MDELFAAFQLRVDAIAVDFSLALRNVARQRRRSALALLAVIFGVTSYILAAGFIDWTLWSMREDTIRSQTGHFQVARKGFTDSGAADPWAFLIEKGRPIETILREHRAVIQVAPRIAYTGLISLGDATLSFVGEGVDPAKEGDLGRAVQIVDGGALDAADPRGVILGQGLATNLGAKVGDTVVVVATTRSGGIAAVECTVRGIFTTVSKAYDDQALRAPISLVWKLLQITGIHKWIVLLRNTDMTAAVAETFRTRFENLGLEIVPWTHLADFYNKTVTLFRKQVTVVKIIIALIIILSISNTFTMAVMERTSEIGSSLALGAQRVQILRQFLIEGGLIGLIGGILGAVTGYALAVAISAVGIAMPPPPGMARGYTAQIMVTWTLAVDAIVLALLTALIASLYPAWKASRLEIVDALRHSR